MASRRKRAKAQKNTLRPASSRVVAGECLRAARDLRFMHDVQEIEEAFKAADSETALAIDDSPLPTGDLPHA